MQKKNCSIGYNAGHYQSQHHETGNREFVGTLRQSRKTSEGKDNKKKKKLTPRQLTPITCPDCGIICVGVSSANKHKRNKHPTVSASTFSGVNDK